MTAPAGAESWEISVPEGLAETGFRETASLGIRKFFHGQKKAISPGREVTGLRESLLSQIRTKPVHQLTQYPCAFTQLALMFPAGISLKGKRSLSWVAIAQSSETPLGAWSGCLVGR